MISMETTVIQEIANQLGMAADQASIFIATYLPDYAALQVIGETVDLVGKLIALVALSCAFMAAVLKLRSMYARVELEDDDSDYALVCRILLFVLGGFAAVASLALLTSICSDIPRIIGWSNYPEAMLIQEVLEKIN